MPLPVNPSAPYGPYGPNVTPIMPAGAKGVPTVGGLLNALKRRWVMATFVGGLVAALVATGIWFALPGGKHQARALIQLRSKGPDFIEKTQDDFDTYRKNQVFNLRTRDLLTRTLQAPEVAGLAMIRTSDDPVRLLEESIKADIVAPEIIAVTMTGDNPEDLRKIVDNLVKKYLDDASSAEFRERDIKFNKFTSMQQKLLGQIDGEERSINNTALANRITGGEASEKRLAFLQQRIAELDAEIAAKEREIREKKAHFDLLKGQIAAGKVAIVEHMMEKALDAHGTVAPLLPARSELARRLKLAKENAVDETAPTVVDLASRLAKVDEEIDAARKLARPMIEKDVKAATIADLQDKASVLEKDLLIAQTVIDSNKQVRDDLDKQVANGGVQQINLNSQIDALKPKKDLLARLNAILTQLQVEKEMEQRVTQREPATPIVTSTFNKKVMLASGGGVMAFLGILVLVGFLEWRTRRIDGVDSVVNDLGMRIIGTVPAFPNKANLNAAKGGSANWRFVLNESINSTRTMLLHAARHQSMQVVMVTSATQGEGKTSLSSQLATSMATAGMRTLIVDCDLRNPSIHKLFDLGLTAGVSEVLCQDADVTDAVQPTTVPNLWVIPAGQCSNRVIAALAQGHPLETLFNRLRGQFDFIIVDSCPVLPVADALLIGQHVDGVVFSIMQDVSQLPKVQTASEKLAQLNIPLVGAVLNGIRQNVYSYGYNYVKQLPA
ncbi:MAG TPA: polysaccharide biosynthesis tyrosine autokinase [Gemmataceae bacterium]|nr:polysaccharide biosynthesis tyrosine autokinase [Gemmataceae bacterium]